MAVWFAGTVIAPALRQTWHLSGGEAGWLTSAVQLGFVAGTLAAAALNLADTIPSRIYFAACALLAAAANGLLVAAPGFTSAVLLRFLTGLFLAGVYPPAMKMAATWFRSSRGLAIGTVVGALTVGKALPYLIDAGGGGVRPVVIGASAAAVAASALVLFGYRDGPNAFPRRPFSWRLAAEVARNRELRLVTAGYLGHMWELYCFWAWIAAFLAASADARVAAGLNAPGPGAVRVLAFAIIALGSVACIAGGAVADRIGREQLVVYALAASGSCAVLIGFTFGRSFWLLVPLAVAWGLAVIADSAQFSALVTELAPVHAVGTALTLQTSLGFLLTVVTIQMVPHVVGWAGWAWAFPALALGPVVGIGAIRRLQRGPRGAAPSRLPRVSRPG